LTDVGINFRREHLPLSQRTHMIITSGGSQPNVVPGTASMWYYFRQNTRDRIQELWDTGNAIAKGAAMMTGTDVSWKLLGTAYTGHMNKPCAEALYANIQRVGMPKWDEGDQAFGKMLQRMMKGPERGLATEVGRLGGPTPLEQNYGGGSDDIADIAWNVPTCSLSYPGNVPGMQGHHWSSAIAEATPVAHKGVTAGAKVIAMTMVDLLLKPEIITQAQDYFTNVQTKTEKYQPFITAKDMPPIHINDKQMAEYREKLKPYYFNPAKFKTYLEQLGTPYPPPPNTPLGTDLK
jgi:aminobenzoyl-glutamate utilization protein B